MQGCNLPSLPSCCSWAVAVPHKKSGLTSYVIIDEEIEQPGESVKNTRPDIKLLPIILIVVGLMALFTWLNYQYTGSTTANDDLFPFWSRTRQFVTEGASPYSPKTTHGIQRSIYGRLAHEREDQKLFVYPYYSMLLFAPFTITGNYPLAHAVWVSLLAVGVLGIAYASVILTGWQPSKTNLAIFLLFSLIWLYSLWPVIRGNSSVLVALVAVLALLCLVYQQYHLTGVLLALATIKPNMVVLLIVFIIFWSWSYRETTLVTYFLITLTLLAGTAMIAQPDWIVLYLQQLMRYLQYAPASTPAAIFSQWIPNIGQRIGQVFSAGVSLLLVREWISAYHKGEQWFLWTAAVTLAATPLTGIPYPPVDYIIMLPVMVLLFSLWEQRWQQNGRWLSLVMMCVMLIRPYWTYLANYGQADLTGKLFFFTPLLLVLALYWMRYWTLKSHRIPIEVNSAPYDL